MDKTRQAKSPERTPETLRRRLGTRSIALVGMPGSGKSSIGRRLAPRLGLSFVDADTKIQEAAGGMSIADIFAKHGEAEFRSLEARVIARILDGGSAVIATGGGAFMNPETRALARRCAISIWLKADIPVLLRRVKRKSGRPLLAGQDPEAALKRLLAERETDYAEADVTIVSRDGPHEEVIEAILRAIEQKLEDESGMAGKRQEAQA